MATGYLYQFIGARQVMLDAGELFTKHITGYHVLNGAGYVLGSPVDPYNLGFVIEEWHTNPRGVKPGKCYYVRFERSETITDEWDSALMIAHNAMAQLGYEETGWRDLVSLESTDSLADYYDTWLSENMPTMPEILQPGFRMSADEAWHEIAHLTETLDEVKRWLWAFMQRWEYIQSREDHERAIAARGEA